MPGLFDGTPLERPVTCDRCGRVVAECGCPEEKPAPQAAAPVDQSPRVRRERRRGKWNTVVAGIDPSNQKELLSELKSKLGVGGGLSDGELVLQGDRRDAVVEKLCEMGYAAKPAGG